MTTARRRVAATSTLCAAATILFLIPAALTDSAELSPMVVLCGFTIPAGVAGLYWAIALDPGQAEDLTTTVALPRRSTREETPPAEQEKAA